MDFFPLEYQHLSINLDFQHVVRSNHGKVDAIEDSCEDSSSRLLHSSDGVCDQKVLR